MIVNSTALRVLDPAPINEIRRWMKWNHYTREQAAARFAVSAYTLDNWLRGDNPVPVYVLVKVREGIDD